MWRLFELALVVVNSLQAALALIRYVNHGCPRSAGGRRCRTVAIVWALTSSQSLRARRVNRRLVHHLWYHQIIITAILLIILYSVQRELADLIILNQGLAGPEL